MSTKKEREYGDMLALVADEIQGELDAVREARKLGRYKRTTQAIYRIQMGINDLRALAKGLRE